MTFTALIAAAAATGALGAWHCAAMCGPLAVGGCRDARRAAGYFGGRLVAYAAVGAVVGAAGARLAHSTGFARVQTVALIALAAAAAWRGWSLLRPPPLAKLGARRRRSWTWIAEALPREGLGLGLVTGVLPCGMLMAAWMLAAAAGDPLRGAAVMAVFCAASAPGLIAPLLARRLARKLPRRAAGVAWCALAVWLALWPMLGGAHAHHAPPDSTDPPACH